MSICYITTEDTGLSINIYYMNADFTQNFMNFHQSLWFFALYSYPGRAQVNQKVIILGASVPWSERPGKFIMAQKKS